MRCFADTLLRCSTMTQLLLPYQKSIIPLSRSFLREQNIWKLGEIGKSQRIEHEKISLLLKNFHFPGIPRTTPSWWLNHPFEKKMFVNLVHFHKYHRGKIKISKPPASYGLLLQTNKALHENKSSSWWLNQPI